MSMSPNDPRLAGLSPEDLATITPDSAAPANPALQPFIDDPYLAYGRAKYGTVDGTLGGKPITATTNITGKTVVSRVQKGSGRSRVVVITYSDGTTEEKADPNIDEEEVSRTFIGKGKDRIRVTTWTDGRVEYLPDPEDVPDAAATAAELASAAAIAKTNADNETSTTILTKTLEFYGLNDPDLVNEIRAALANRTITGSSSIDEIGIQLRESPAFKRRFVANEKRRELGKPVYSVSQLLQLESQYRRNLRDSGMPAGFYDDPTSLQNFLINDISPDEILARVTQGYQAVRNADPTVINELKTLYNLDDGSIAAFFVDPTKAQDNIVRAARAAEVGAQARKQAGIGLTAASAEELVRQGVSEADAQAGFTTFKQQESLYRPLMGEETFTQEQAIAGTLGTSAEAAQRVATRKRRRRGTFEAGGKVSLSTVE